MENPNQAKRIPILVGGLPRLDVDTNIYIVGGHDDRQFIAACRLLVTLSLGLELANFHDRHATYTYDSIHSSVRRVITELTESGAHVLSTHDGQFEHIIEYNDPWEAWWSYHSNDADLYIHYDAENAVSRVFELHASRAFTALFVAVHRDEETSRYRWNENEQKFIAEPT